VVSQIGNLEIERVAIDELVCLTQGTAGKNDLEMMPQVAYGKRDVEHDGQPANGIDEVKHDYKLALGEWQEESGDDQGVNRGQCLPGEDLDIACDLKTVGPVKCGQVR